MRILYHHRTRGRHVEGVHIRGVIGGLRDLGHEVRVLSFPGADPEREPAAAGAPAPRAGWLGAIVSAMPGPLFELLELLYNLPSWWRVSRQLVRWRPALVYERYSLYLCVTVWLARRHGVPVILEVNDSALVERLRPLYFAGLARRIERWCLAHATGLVFISRRFRELVAAAYGPIAPSIVSPNAVDQTRFDPARVDRARERASHGLEQRVVCGYAGVFAHWHGLEGFVERIVSRLCEAPALTLLLLGDGRAWPALRAMVDARGLNERILLPGRVPHAEMPRWIACMDFAVLPDSNEYGSPMKLFEFMAMGVAVVAPDYEPVRDVVEHGVTGWLFPRKQVDTCVDAVLARARDPEGCRQVGAAARDYIARERTWRRNAEQLLTLLPASVGR